jgi:hypothetical protein
MTPAPPAIESMCYGTYKCPEAPTSWENLTVGCHRKRCTRRVFFRTGNSGGLNPLVHGTPFIQHSGNLVPVPVSLVASRALFRCAMQHIASRHAVVGSGRSMLSSHRFAPSTFLLHSLSSSSPPSSSRGARFFSGGRPPPSGPVVRSASSRTPLTPVLASDTSLRKTDEQLRKLNEEIDAVAAEIRAKEAERKTEADVAEKAIILKSIDVLNEALKGLRDHRRELSLAGIAAQVPAPGKSTPLCECCALCGRRPLLCVCRRLTPSRPLLSPVTTPSSAPPLRPSATTTQGKNRPFIAIPTAPTAAASACSP